MEISVCNVSFLKKGKENFSTIMLSILGYKIFLNFIYSSCNFKDNSMTDSLRERNKYFNILNLNILLKQTTKRIL